jgi:hypothetical protein
MERSPICPGCLSKYEDIKGLVYRDGNPVGEQCSDVWHRGVTYNPDRWVLTAYDEEFLSEQHIAQR